MKTNIKYILIIAALFLGSCTEQEEVKPVIKTETLSSENGRGITIK